MVIADAEQLKRVINNIVSNSVKYLDKKKGIINIRIRDAGDFIQVEHRGQWKRHRDQGSARIFLTGSTARILPEIPRQGGSGIGLSIVKKIIEDHGGRIWATSREGTGTDHALCIKKISGGSRRMSKILIVEDEESIAELEKDYLELSGFEVEIENRRREPVWSGR